MLDLSALISTSSSVAISACGTCLSVGFAFSAPHQVVQGERWGCSSPPRSALVVYGDVDGVAFGCWASEGLRCSDRRMGPSCPSRGCTFLHPKARAGGEASTCTQRQITLLPGEVIFQLSLCFLRFHFCSYRLVLPCKENNT